MAEENMGLVKTELIDMAGIVPASCPAFYAGGLGGKFAVDYQRLWLAPFRPKNVAVGVWDTCFSNEAYQAGNGGPLRFWRLDHPGNIWFRNQVQDPRASHWGREVSGHVFRDEFDLNDKGLLEARNRVLPVVIPNLERIAHQAEEVIGSCGFPTVESVSPHVRYVTFTHSLGGGSGGGINHHAAHLYRAHYGYAGGARDSWVRGVGIGYTSYPHHPSMQKIYQAIQAAELRTLSRQMLFGTSDPDKRFRGVLPGFEKYVHEDGEMPPGHFDEFVVLEKQSMGGGELTLDLLAEMAGADLHFRSLVPRLTEVLKELQVEYRDKLRDAEEREGQAYRFSSFGLRCILPHPNLQAMRTRHVAGMVAAQALGGRDDAPLTFSEAHLVGLFDEWNAKLIEAGVRVPSVEALTGAIARDPEAEISQQKYRIEETLYGEIRRAFASSVETGQAANALAETLTLEIRRRKESGNLRSLFAIMESLSRRLNGVVPPRGESLEDWSVQLSRYAADIDDRKRTLGDVGAVGEESLGQIIKGWIKDAWRGASRGATVPEEDAEVRRHSRAAARILVTLQSQLRDAEVWSRIIAVRDYLRDDVLAPEIEAVRTMVVELSRFGEATEREVGKLWQGGMERRTVITHIAATPSAADAVRGLSVPEGAVSAALKHLAEGVPVHEACDASLVDNDSFTSLMTGDQSAIRFWVRALAETTPQAPIDMTEYGAATPTLRKLVLCPPSLATFVRKGGIDNATVVLAVPGLDALVFYVQIDCLRPGAIATTRAAEQSLMSLSERDFELSHIWLRYAAAGCLLSSDRANVEEQIAAAILLNGEANQQDGLSLNINGVQILGAGDMHAQAPLKQRRENTALPDAEPHWQWQIAVTLDDNRMFTRTLDTNHPGVLVDMVSGHSDFRDALDSWIRRSARGLDFGARTLLASAVSEMDVWLKEELHIQAEDAARIRNQEDPDADRSEDQLKARAARVELVVWVTTLRDAAKRFNGNRHWVQEYKRERSSTNVVAVNFARVA